MADDDDDASTIVTLPCPRCGGAVEATLTDRPQVVDCPHCSAPFVLPALGEQVAVARVSAAGDGFIVDDTPGDEEFLRKREREDHLDRLKSRQIVALRKAAYRSRGYQLMGAAICLVGAGQCLYYVYVKSARPDPAVERAVAYLIVLGWLALAAVGIVFGVKLLTKARQMKEAAERSALAEPDTEPDFTPLSDGSQRWKNLEDTRDDRK